MSLSRKRHDKLVALENHLILVRGTGRPRTSFTHSRNITQVCNSPRENHSLDCITDISVRRDLTIFHDLILGAPTRFGPAKQSKKQEQTSFTKLMSKAARQSSTIARRITDHNTLHTQASLPKGFGKFVGGIYGITLNRHRQVARRLVLSSFTKDEMHIRVSIG